MAKRVWFLLPLVFAACSTPATDAGDDTDPVDDGAACEGDVCVLTGTITESLTLTADKEWLLRGGVFIGDDVAETVLTVEPGTKIYGESATDGMLVVRRGSKLVAEGTAEAPIVFSSSKNKGERAAGDWGGLVLNGRALVNSCDDPEVLCEAYGEGGTGWYGGDDDGDSSGVLRYVRVEFAGTLISPDNELNGIAFQGVGSGTEVEYVQVHQNADDGVEFFGGAVDARHVLVTDVGDDGIDWTDGWRGRLQFAAVQQWPDQGDQGIEADNNAESNGAEPRSNPTLANITLVGSPESAASDLGILLREGTSGLLSHVLVKGFGEACLDVDHAETFANGKPGLENTVLDCAVATIEGEEGEDVDLKAWFEGGEGNAVKAAALTNPYDLAAPDLRPTAKISAPAVDLGEFFEAADYVGAFDTEDWTAGWTTTEAN
jgi:hypothetical protein